MKQLGNISIEKSGKDVDLTYDSFIVTLYSIESPDKTVVLRYNID